MFAPYAVRTDGSERIYLLASRLFECGPNETAFVEIRLVFAEKIPITRDRSAEGLEWRKLRLFLLGDWTAAASLWAMEAAAQLTLVLHPPSKPGKLFSPKLVGEK